MNKNIFGLALVVLSLLTVFQVSHSQERAKKIEHAFEVVEHFFAKEATFDKEGRCLAIGNIKLKSWLLPGFPADIPHFESCTTIYSETAKGEVSISFRIQDQQKNEILKVMGVVNLGKDGQGSQAIDWDHLKIPKPGQYQLVVSVGEKILGRYPMKFRKAFSKESTLPKPKTKK